ncbi:hypothetical protein OS493_003419 [Desmophyllum pertusum]|uniref:UPAR/Ly6 domain-containing protein n=1 Tax=Desmophyllum pertusum TaxID=174260 RepID=A0A9X0A5V7_9CNID|nr:hypothetical protein OS493_003419 [Desmophyllum pertusum]
MKFAVVPLVVLFFGALRVHSLECYQCAASSSLDDCSSQETQVTCPPGLPKCGIVEVTYEAGGVSGAAFVKGCLTDDICEGREAAGCDQPGINCDIKCCSDDLCNGEGGGEGSSAESLSCNKCLSSVSMDDCNEHQKEKQCSPKENRCGIMSAHKESTLVFAKDCIPEELCPTFCKDGFNEEGGFECELSCCEGNFCNINQKNTLA